MRTLNFSILFVYLNFNKFPSDDFRVHWNARNSKLGKTNSEMTTSEQSGTRHKYWSTDSGSALRWEGNCRSGFAPAEHHRILGSIIYPPTG